MVDTYVMNFVEGLDEEKVDNTFVANMWRVSGESAYKSYCGIWLKKNSNTEANSMHSSGSSILILPSPTGSTGNL